MLFNLVQLFFSVLNKFSFLPPLLGRLTVGLVFYNSGWGKLHNLEKVTAYFLSLGIPAPHIQAPFVAGLEFVGGVLLVTGLFTRIISIPLIGVMFVAIATAKIDQITSLNSLLNLSEFLFVLILIWLAICGPGNLSLDRLVLKKWTSYWK